ncbi:MAG: M23 family metallopeptidase [Spirochaetes bacterium]|nr:M23 family metallopeptidase [Spirochaetota bacterium]
MRGTKIFLILSFLSIWGGTKIVWSYQWPTEPRILSVFAQGGTEGFERGIRISANNTEVKPIEEGELIFFCSEGSVASLPYPLGSFVVLQHGNTLRSIYAHLDFGNLIQKTGKTKFQKNDGLGKTGLTGSTSIIGLSLFTYDLEAKQFVNPLLLLPPVKDTSRPIIRNAQLEKKDRMILLPTTEPVPKGIWEVTAEVFDLSAAVPTFWPMGIYKVSLYLNGQERFMVTMDTLKEQGGVTRVFPSEGLAYDKLYSKDGFRMKLGTVNLNPGVLNLEIVARDFSGNERNQLYRFRVE